MSIQITLYGDSADLSLMIRHEGDATRTYRFRQSASVTNLVDQMSLVSGRTKSEVVADSIRLTALISKIVGYDAIELVTKCDDVGDLLNFIKSSI